jgi:hypothetical protein
MIVTTVGGNALIVTADVDGKGDPNCEEQSPIDKFES